MDEYEFSILCGKCRVQVEKFHVGFESMVRCPKCGETDTLRIARREAGEHTAHQLLQRILAHLLDSKPSRASRFIEDLRPRHVRLSVLPH
jgi:hypothetical protein